MPEPEPPVSAAFVIVAVPAAFQKNDPSLGAVRLPQVKPRLRPVVACDRPVAQVDPLQAPLLLQAVLLQNLDQLLDRVPLDRCRARRHRNGVRRFLPGGDRRRENRQAHDDLKFVRVLKFDILKFQEFGNFSTISAACCNFF